MAALGFSGLGAGRFYSRIDNFRMSLGRNLFHSGKYCSALQACFAGLASGVGAGSIFFLMFNRLMTCCRYCLGFGLLTHHASVCLDTRPCAGGLC